MTYEQMVAYVDRVTTPMETHMSTHDAWHLNQVTADERARRANFRANLSIFVAAAAVVVTVIFGILHR